MAKKDTAIYEPPKKGFPYLVVTVLPDGVQAVPVDSRPKARKIVLERREAREKLEKQEKKARKKEA